MAYADYAYYTNIYKGASVPESVFDTAAERASEILDSLTFGRITGDWIDDDSVKKACCAIAERQYTADQRGADVKSESVGSYSVTYADGGGTNAKNVAIATRYLAGTGLLYRGLP